MLAKQSYLGDLIRERVPLGRLTSTGFYEQRCSICNDHSIRAGWKITPDIVFFNCYNCHFHASYEEGSGIFSYWMKQVCRANGLSDQDLQDITATLFFNKKEKTETEITLESLRKISLNTPEISFPARSYKFGVENNEEIQAPLIEYLFRRCVEPTKFYFSTDPAHLRRIIIPFWKDGRLIYWQSRSIDKDVKPKYKNAAVSKDAVIYGYDQLFSYNTTPLFVTEGVFDAECVNGICILGSSLNATKIELLKKTKRRMIFVIDRDSNGGDLGQQVIDLGWELTFVDKNADDVNDSMQKFGKLFTIYSLMKNATSKLKPVEASLNLGLELMGSRLRKTRYM